MSFPRISDINNNKSYNKFSMMVKEKNIFVYNIRHLIILYLNTDINAEYTIFKFVNSMIEFLTNEIYLLDSEFLAYVNNDELKIILDEYIEYKKENNI
jgi:hypothetical protein